MQNFIKSYSRAIKWAKLIMPVIAVLLLASVFIFGKEDALRSGTISIDADTINLTTDQKITNPQFSGLTNLGDSFILKAIEAMPDSPSPEKIDLIGPSLEFDALPTPAHQSGGAARTARSESDVWRSRPAPEQVSPLTSAPESLLAT